MSTKLLHRIAASLTLLVSLILAAPPLIAPSFAQSPEQRFALVIGNSEYKAGRLPTAANDAGLVAETLRVAGFDVAGARDLDWITLRRSVAEFLEKISAAGPEAVTFVYLAGYGLQFEGENYIVPIDATLNQPEHIPVEALRISDFMRALARAPGMVKIIVVDAARQHPFLGMPLGNGLSLVEPGSGTLIAFNTAPGSIAPIENGPYGAFAQSLAEMIGTGGGLGLDDLFARLRLRVNEMSNGVAVPWYASGITHPFLLVERTPDAPAASQTVDVTELKKRAIRDFGNANEAFAAALVHDSLKGYEEFLTVYPHSPLASRVRALIAVRREAIIWRRTLDGDTREAYWSYLRRYLEGAHVVDAQRRLGMLAASLEPPPGFAPIAYDVPPPSPDEVTFLRQPVVLFDGAVFAPPPPIPVSFLPPRPPQFVALAPPAPPIGPFFLPVPVGPSSLNPPWTHPPASVRPPPPAPSQRILIERLNGSAAPLSAALPVAVVTRLNAGTLQPPPPAAPPPVPIRLPATAAASMLMQRLPHPPSAAPRSTGLVTEATAPEALKSPSVPSRSGAIGPLAPPDLPPPGTSPPTGPGLATAAPPPAPGPNHPTGPAMSPHSVAPAGEVPLESPSPATTSGTARTPHVPLPHPRRPPANLPSRPELTAATTIPGVTPPGRTPPNAKRPGPSISSAAVSPLSPQVGNRSPRRRASRSLSAPPANRLEPPPRSIF
jgi:uncharacterized caspase-like protein